MGDRNGPEHANKNELTSILIPHFSVCEFLERKIKAPENLLGELFKIPSLNMISAGEGVGKTHLSMGIQRAISTGTTILNLEAPLARKTLIIDGEMNGGELQRRFADSCKGQPSSDKYTKNSGVITFSDFVDETPDLTEPRWQNELDKVIDTNLYEVLIIDNLSSCLGGKDLATDVKEVITFINWCKHLRNNKNLAVFLINHNTKGSKTYMGVPQLTLFNNTNIGLTKNKSDQVELVVQKCRHKQLVNRKLTYSMEISSGFGTKFKVELDEINTERTYSPY